MGQIRRRAVVLGPLAPIDVSPDPDDGPLIATAVEGRADWLVTRDKLDLLELVKVQGVRIVSARVFVDVLGL